MKKQLLSEEFTRMQKLAGIITEGEGRGLQIRPVPREEYEEIKDEIDWDIPGMDSEGYIEGMIGLPPNERNFQATATYTEFDGLDIDEDSVEEIL